MGKVPGENRVNVSTPFFGKAAALKHGSHRRGKSQLYRILEVSLCDFSTFFTVSLLCSFTSRLRLQTTTAAAKTRAAVDLVTYWDGHDKPLLIVNSYAIAACRHRMGLICCSTWFLVVFFIHNFFLFPRYLQRLSRNSLHGFRIRLVVY